MLRHMTHRPEHATSETTNVLRILGGPKVLGSSPQNDHDYILLVREGLPYGSLSTALVELAIPFKTLEEHLHLNARTMLRRKHGRLTLIQSERVMRLVRVAARAEAVFGDRATALDWLSSPNRALDGQDPIALLDTDLGAYQVLQVLGRLEHSVYT